jgi:hypothetical protein
MAGRSRDRVIYGLAALVAVVVAVISFGAGTAHAASQDDGAPVVEGAAHLELAPFFLLVALIVAGGLTWLAARRRRPQDDGHPD